MTPRPRHHYLECSKCESCFKVAKDVTSVPAHKCWAAEKEAARILDAPTDPAVLLDADGCLVWTLRHPDLTRLADELLPLALRWPTLKPDTALGIAARRHTCAFGRPGAVYRYSQTTKVAAAWPAELHALHDEVVRRTGEDFNFALVNLYPDGNAALGWHADDERDLAAGAPIVSVSLGATRVFALRNESTGEVRGAVLEHGSMCVMTGETQRRWKHCITKDARVKTPRVSITFRRLA